MSKLSAAADWGKPPWELGGLEPSRWDRLVWLHRWELVEGERNKRQAREAEEMRLKAMQNRGR